MSRWFLVVGGFLADPTVQWHTGHQLQRRRQPQHYATLGTDFLVLSLQTIIAEMAVTAPMIGEPI
jgi:hypothetical protein